MKQKTFINNLKEALEGIPQDQFDDIIADYEEHFKDGLEAGKTESELSKSLGNPDKIANQYLKELRVEEAIVTATAEPSANNIWQAIMATVALSLFNIIFVVGPFFGMIGVLFGFVAAALSITASGISLIIASIISPFTDIIFMDVHPIVGGLAGIASTSFGILFSIGVYYMFKLAYKITVSYLKFNINLIRKK